MDANTLATRFLDHAKREECLLESLFATVSMMRSAILEKNQERIQEVSENTDLASEVAAVSDSRHALRDEISKTFAVPPNQATAALLARRCDEALRIEIQSTCQRLRTRSSQLSVMLTATNNLAFQLWELLDSVFRALSGDSMSPKVYDRTGSRRVE